MNVDDIIAISKGERKPSDEFANTAIEVLTDHYPALEDVWITMFIIMPTADAETRRALIKHMSRRLSEYSIGVTH